MVPAVRPTQRRRRHRVLVAAAAAAVAAYSGVYGAVTSAARVVPCWEGVAPELVLSRALSLGVIAGSLVGKLPQVYAIWKARSAAGVSVVSMWVEASSMGIQLAYNIVRGTPLTTYAEVPILFAQLLLLVLTAAWAEAYLGPRVALGVLSLVVGTAAMALRVVPVVITTALFAANASCGLAIMGPQVAMTCKSRSTGQLSFVVVAMTFCGQSSRLFTTMVEVEDPSLRAAHLLNWLLVAALLVQFLRFPRGPQEPVMRNLEQLRNKSFEMVRNKSLEIVRTKSFELSASVRPHEPCLHRSFLSVQSFQDLW
mmetsp:Transcript_68154/g.158163  ORF Transcript_68154/g.158163 Transcript_68154/m.158163 type:complete len:311 (+) Transcript_68154:51-983(+)